MNEYQEALHTYTNISDYVNILEPDDVPKKKHIADDEDLYKDPGHSPVMLRNGFEKKEHCLINESDIRLGLML